MCCAFTQKAEKGSVLERQRESEIACGVRVREQLLPALHWSGEFGRERKEKANGK